MMKNMLDSKRLMNIEQQEKDMYYYNYWVEEVLVKFIKYLIYLFRDMI